MSKTSLGLLISAVVIGSSSVAGASSTCHTMSTANWCNETMKITANAAGTCNWISASSSNEKSPSFLARVFTKVVNLFAAPVSASHGTQCDGTTNWVESTKNNVSQSSSQRWAYTNVGLAGAHYTLCAVGQPDHASINWATTCGATSDRNDLCAIMQMGTADGPTWCTAARTGQIAGYLTGGTDLSACW